MTMPLIDVASASDADPLACFAAGRDQRAFAEIVWRHGPMVMGAARRMLRDEHDAEDAFQATFLALASAAGKVRWRPVVAAWLYQTALRSAKSIGRMNARWRRRVEEASGVLQPSYETTVAEEVRAAVDEELRRLPEKYRAAVVLCDLESLSRNEAAVRLGVPASTVRTRLARGRELLRSRLLKRGVTISSVGFVAGIGNSGEASALITTALVQSTTGRALLFAAGKSAAKVGVSQSVFQSASGVVKAMTITQLSTTAVAAVVICLSAGLFHETIGMLESTAAARTIFLDDFSDGDYQQGQVVWTPDFITNGQIDASSGDLILTPTSESVYAMSLDALDYELSNVSVRAQGRVSVEGGFLAITARNQAVDNVMQYFGVVSYRPQLGGTVLALGRADHFSGQDDQGNEFFGDFPVLPFDVRTEDAVIQLDVIGNQLSLWGWKAGDPKPTTPQLTALDDTYASGFVRIGGGIGDNGDSVTTIRYVQVADASIPEPATGGMAALAAGVLLLGCLRRWG